MKSATGYRRATREAKGRMLLCMTAVLLSALSGAAVAQDGQQKACVELQTIAQVEEHYVDEQGRSATRLVPVGKIVPGDEVVWTIVAKNVCDTAAENIQIANPVPEHMSYVANSAMGIGTQITYSVDGEHFMPAEQLTVRDADGATRPARPEEYRGIRWTYSAPFDKGATAFVRYRAIVN